MIVQTPTTRYEFEHNYPVRSTAQQVFDEQDLQRAIEAYRFFYPSVSAEAIFEANRVLGVADGQGLIALFGGPQHTVFTANSDTPYASGVLDLGVMGPVVIDVPAGPYVALVDDHHQRWVIDMGIPGPDAGASGKYLIVPPDHEGALPDGYHAARCPTYKALLAVRAVPVGGDAQAAFDALQNVKVYALDDPHRVLPYVDVTHRPLDSTPLRWETNLEFWRRLHAVIDDEPAILELRPMFGVLAALGIEKGRPFAPDARMRGILEAGAQRALDQMRVEGFASRRPDRLVWKDRAWEWVGLVPDDADFETADFLDLQARDRWFVQAICASPAMFRRQAGVGSVYFLGARDRGGAYLDGTRTYKLTVPQPVPAKMFWSVTAYDSGTRSQVRTQQHKAVLGSLQSRFEPNADGSIDLYFGPRAPAAREDQWIQTEPGSGFFLYFRIYGPDAAALDGRWQLDDLAPLD
jgi:hypothetical protein